MNVSLVDTKANQTEPCLVLSTHSSPPRLPSSQHLATLFEREAMESKIHFKWPAHGRVPDIPSEHSRVLACKLTTSDREPISRGSRYEQNQLQAGCVEQTGGS